MKKHTYHYITQQYTTIPTMDANTLCREIGYTTKITPQTDTKLMSRVNDILKTYLPAFKKHITDLKSSKNDNTWKSATLNLFFYGNVTDKLTTLIENRRLILAELLLALRIARETACDSILLTAINTTSKRTYNSLWSNKSQLQNSLTNLCAEVANKDFPLTIINATDNLNLYYAACESLYQSSLDQSENTIQQNLHSITDTTHSLINKLEKKLTPKLNKLQKKLSEKNDNCITLTNENHQKTLEIKSLKSTILKLQSQTTPTTLSPDNNIAAYKDIIELQTKTILSLIDENSTIMEKYNTQQNHIDSQEKFIQELMLKTLSHEETLVKQKELISTIKNILSPSQNNQITVKPIHLESSNLWVTTDFNEYLCKHKSPRSNP